MKAFVFLSTTTKENLIKKTTTYFNMGIPTYEYPPKAYPMVAKYFESGQCIHCGHKNVTVNDNYTCTKCSTKVHGGVEVNSMVYFHGKLVNYVVGRVPIFRYPPKRYPIEPGYNKPGRCVHCKKKVEKNDFRCAGCKVYLRCGVQVGNTVYYHGKAADTSNGVSSISFSRCKSTDTIFLNIKSDMEYVEIERKQRNKTNVLLMILVIIVLLFLALMIVSVFYKR